VISLAGGWPDTSTFPPDSYAALMSTVASRSCARALQYGPTEGLMLVKNCVAQVMRSEGWNRSGRGGVDRRRQQVIDIVCRRARSPAPVVSVAPTPAAVSIPSLRITWATQFLTSISPSVGPYWSARAHERLATVLISAA